VHHCVRVDEGREFLVAWSTVKAVEGEKVVPGYIDRLLGRDYAAEETTILADPDSPDNLWEPAPGAYGAHGPFDDRAKTFSTELWLSKHRPWLAVAGAMLVGAALGARAKGDRS
jgi:hypothetical protein